jgi:hypothetical protein
MDTVEPHPSDVGLLLICHSLVARGGGAPPLGQIIWENDLQTHAPQVPIVQQVRVGSVAAA